MNEDRLSDYLDEMRQAARDACAFVEGFSREDFLADVRTQRAVIMSLMIIGEAASKILDRHALFADENPSTPWRSMRGMRNRIAHGYFDIDLAIVWDTVRIALPDLLETFPSVDGEEGRSGRREGG